MIEDQYSKLRNQTTDVKVVGRRGDSPQHGFQASHSRPRGSEAPSDEDKCVVRLEAASF